MFPQHSTAETSFEKELFVPPHNARNDGVHLNKIEYKFMQSTEVKNDLAQLINTLTSKPPYQYEDEEALNQSRDQVKERMLQFFTEKLKAIQPADIGIIAPDNIVYNKVANNPGNIEQLKNTLKRRAEEISLNIVEARNDAVSTLIKLKNTVNSNGFSDGLTWLAKKEDETMPVFLLGLKEVEEDQYPYRNYKAIAQNSAKTTLLEKEVEYLVNTLANMEASQLNKGQLQAIAQLKNNAIFREKMITTLADAKHTNTNSALDKIADQHRNSFNIGFSTNSRKTIQKKIQERLSREPAAQNVLNSKDNYTDKL